MRVGVWGDIFMGVRGLGDFTFVVMFFYVRYVVGIIDIVNIDMI